MTDTTTLPTADLEQVQEQIKWAQELAHLSLERHAALAASLTLIEAALSAGKDAQNQVDTGFEDLLIYGQSIARFDEFGNRRRIDPYDVTIHEPNSQKPADMKAADADVSAVRDDDRIDAAYLERNRVVAVLAKCFPSGLKRTAIEGWDAAWHNCGYIDLPTGQASWHYHDRDDYLFEGLPPYAGQWDGHSTPEKYDRLQALTSASPDVLRCADELASYVMFTYQPDRNGMISLAKAYRSARQAAQAESG